MDPNTVMYILLGAIAAGVLLGLVLSWRIRSTQNKKMEEATAASRKRGVALDYMKLDRDGRTKVPEHCLFEFTTLRCDWIRLGISQVDCFHDLERQTCESCRIREWAEEKLKEMHRRTGR